MQNFNICQRPENMETVNNEETNRLQFNGYLNLELNNNLNFGEQLLVNYKADGNEQQNFREEPADNPFDLDRLIRPLLKIPMVL